MPGHSFWQLIAKAEMDRRGLSIESLASQLNWSAIWLHEAIIRREINPNLIQLRAIATCLGLTLDDLARDLMDPADRSDWLRSLQPEKAPRV